MREHLKLNSYTYLTTAVKITPYFIILVCKQLEKPTYSKDTEKRILKSTNGATLKPNEAATFLRSRLFASNMDFRLCDA